MQSQPATSGLAELLLPNECPMELIYSGFLTKSPPRVGTRVGEHTPTRRFNVSLFKPHWRRRFFALSTTSASSVLPGSPPFKLCYYENEKMTNLKGEIDLQNCSEVQPEDDPDETIYKYVFTLRTLAKGLDRTYYLVAETENEIKEWVKNLRDVLQLSDTVRSASPSVNEVVTTARKSSFQRRLLNTFTLPTKRDKKRKPSQEDPGLRHSTSLRIALPPSSPGYVAHPLSSPSSMSCQHSPESVTTPYISCSSSPKEDILPPGVTRLGQLRYAPKSKPSRGAGSSSNSSEMYMTPSCNSPRTPKFPEGQINNGAILVEPDSDVFYPVSPSCNEDDPNGAGVNSNTYNTAILRRKNSASSTSSIDVTYDVAKSQPDTRLDSFYSYPRSDCWRSDIASDTSSIENFSRRVSRDNQNVGNVLANSIIYDRPRRVANHDHDQAHGEIVCGPSSPRRRAVNDDYDYPRQSQPPMEPKVSRNESPPHQALHEVVYDRIPLRNKTPAVGSDARAVDYSSAPSRRRCNPPVSKMFHVSAASALQMESEYDYPLRSYNIATGTRNNINQSDSCASNDNFIENRSATGLISNRGTGNCGQINPLMVFYESDQHDDDKDDKNNDDESSHDYDYPTVTYHEAEVIASCGPCVVVNGVSAPLSHNPDNMLMLRQAASPLEGSSKSSPSEEFLPDSFTSDVFQSLEKTFGISRKSFIGEAGASSLKSNAIKNSLGDGSNGGGEGELRQRTGEEREGEVWNNYRVKQPLARLSLRQSHVTRESEQHNARDDDDDDDDDDAGYYYDDDDDNEDDDIEDDEDDDDFTPLVSSDNPASFFRTTKDQNDTLQRISSRKDEKLILPTRICNEDDSEEESDNDGN